MLLVEGLEAAYGGSRVLFGIDLAVAAGEAVTLLGRNGMGKTTTVRSIFGLLRASGGSVSAGRIVVDGVDVTGWPSHAIARRGLGLVPEGRHIFPALTAEENLLATRRGGEWTLARVYAAFPRLRERRRNMGHQLSGGEQQMLAIGRALLTNPRLLVLDEATEGLAPMLRDEIWACLAAIKASGQAILVIDKNVDALTRFADRHVVVEKGRVGWTGTTAELRAAPALKDRFLHV